MSGCASPTGDRTPQIICIATGRSVCADKAARSCSDGRRADELDDCACWRRPWLCGDDALARSSLCSEGGGDHVAQILRELALCARTARVIGPPGDQLEGRSRPQCMVRAPTRHTLARWALRAWTTRRGRHVPVFSSEREADRGRVVTWCSFLSAHGSASRLLRAAVGPHFCRRRPRTTTAGKMPGPRVVNEEGRCARKRRQDDRGESLGSCIALH